MLAEDEDDVGARLSAYVTDEFLGGVNGGRSMVIDSGVVVTSVIPFGYSVDWW